MDKRGCPLPEMNAGPRTVFFIFDGFVFGFHPLLMRLALGRFQREVLLGDRLLQTGDCFRQLLAGKNPLRRAFLADDVEQPPDVLGKHDHFAGSA